jgi:hypothetical protein
VTLETAPFAAKALAEHEIQILYRIDGLSMASGPTTTLLNLADATAVPADQVRALEDRYAATVAWTRAPSSDAGQDFHPHIHDIVGGKREDLATRWVLDETARRLLDRADLYEQETDPALRISKRLILQVTDVAQARLIRHGITCAPLGVRVTGLTLTLFRMGLGFATTVVELARGDRQPLAALELLEAQVLLARFGKLAWTDARRGDIVPGTPFLLSDLIHRLACGKDKEPGDGQRVTTYTYARFAEPSPPEERDAFALHLARHYTADYAIARGIQGVEFVADFETVRHAVALEGAATVVGATPERPELPGFLRDFRTGTFRRHYVPIALLARHEHAFLVQRTSASIISRKAMANHATAVEELKDLRQSVLLFRLCYRFSELSFVTMHNALNRAFREVLHVDRMMADLGSDVSNVESHLRELREAADRSLERARHRRYYWASVIGGAALAGLTAYTIGKEATEVVINLTRGTPPAVETHVHTTPGILGVILGLAVALVAFLIGLLRGPPSHGQEEEHAGHLTLHAMFDQVIHTNLKK